MANFQTHLNGGILVSGGAVLTLHGLGGAPEGLTLVLFALGVIGSLLPDIDADSSAPVRAFFGVLGAALAFAWTLPLAGGRPPLELAAIWVGLFLAVRFLLGAVFARFTVHRGIWHSWLAAGFAVLTTANLAHWLLHQSASVAWAAGFMVGVGYLTHLVLDEVFSVDLLSTRVRRSFGTALKPFSLRDPGSSLVMALGVGLLAWFAPAFDLAEPRAPDGIAEWAFRTLDLFGGWTRIGIQTLRAWLG